MSDLTADEIENVITLIEMGSPLGIKCARDIIQYADSYDFKHRLIEELCALTEAMESNGFEV